MEEGQMECEVKGSEWSFQNKENKLELVRAIMAFANTCDGTIKIGFRDGKYIGIDDPTTGEIDPADISNLLKEYIDTPIDFSIKKKKGKCRKVGLEIRVTKLRAPRMWAIPKKDGQCAVRRGNKSENKCIFAKGAVFVRRTGQIDKATAGDYTRMLLEWLREFTEECLVNPDINAMRMILSNPNMPQWHQYLAIVTAKRRLSREAMLTGTDMLWVLSEWTSNDRLSDTEMELLLASALRRGNTMWFWAAHMTQEAIYRTIIDTLQKDTDRDKSDAWKNIIDLANVALTKDQINSIKEAMQASRYTHLRQGANNWPVTKQSKQQGQADIEKYTREYIFMQSQGCAKRLLEKNVKKTALKALGKWGKAYFQMVHRENI